MTIGNPTVQHSANLRQHILSCFYTGSDALKMGTALCFDQDRGTAANHDGTRANYVERPNALNNLAFAGVVLENHPAAAGGQSVRLAGPGSWCRVALASDTVVDATRLNFVIGAGAGAGRWRDAGDFGGSGSAIALQTVTTGVRKEEGSNAATADATGKIITVAAGATANVAAGDIFCVYAGDTDGTTTVIVGEYVVASVDSDTQITLTEACTDAAGTCGISYWTFRGNPTCLAYLEAGPQAGGVQYHQFADGAVTDITQGGKTIWSGGFTVGTADMTHTLKTTKAWIGMHKEMLLNGALVTHDVLITCAGMSRDGSTAMATLEFDGDGDRAVLKWTGVDWQVEYLTGAAVA